MVAASLVIMRPDATHTRNVFDLPPMTARSAHPPPATWSVIVVALIIAISGAARAEPILHVAPAAARDTTVGTIDVAASPVRVYQALTAYGDWTSLFRDITDAGRPFGTRERARVQVASALLQQRWTLESDNVRDRIVRLRRADPAHGPRGRWEFVLVPSDGGRRTLVRFTFQLGGPGFTGVQRERLRLVRERKVHSDLLDLARRFDPDAPRWRRPDDENRQPNPRRSRREQAGERPG